MAFSALLGNVQLSKMAGMERGRRRGGMTNDRDFFFFGQIKNFDIYLSSGCLAVQILDLLASLQREVRGPGIATKHRPCGLLNDTEAGGKNDFELFCSLLHNIAPLILR